MMSLASFLLSLVGFAALALSMPKHYRDLFGKAPRRSRRSALRTGGWALLAASVIPAIIDQGISVGIVLWFGIVTVSALAVAVALTYRTRILVHDFLLFRGRDE